MPLSGEYAPGTSDWSRKQAEAFEASNGQKANDMRGMPIVVLTSVGAKTGLLRKNPLMRVEHDGVYAVMASLGGAPKNPVWYYNVVANPHVELQDGATKRDYLAHEATGEERWLDRADRLWRFAVQRGWNLRHGASLAWRRRQLDYKNAPANGPFAILGARLERLRPDGREELSRAAFDWLHVRLRDDDTGFVADGIGREGGSARDDWAFSYNHGVYIGAALALHRLRPDSRLLAHASRTADDLIERLAPDGVLVDQGAGDGALFGGIAYRHLVDLATADGVDAGSAARIRGFVTGSVDALWRSSERGGLLLAGPRWDAPPTLPATLSAELGAVLATEAAETLERRTVPPASAGTAD